jgi:hypothetical protein
MMDYEFEILTLHKESQHLREMQDLLRKPRYVGDAPETITESLLLETSRQLEDLTVRWASWSSSSTSSSRRCCASTPTGTGKAKAAK